MSESTVGTAPRWRWTILLGLVAVALISGAQALGPAPARAVQTECEQLVLCGEGAPEGDDCKSYGFCRDGHGPTHTSGGGTDDWGHTTDDPCENFGACDLPDPDPFARIRFDDRGRAATMDPWSPGRDPDWVFDRKNCIGFLNQLNQIAGRAAQVQKSAARARRHDRVFVLSDAQRDALREDRADQARIRGKEWSRYNCEQSLGVGGD